MGICFVSIVVQIIMQIRVYYNIYRVYYNKANFMLVIDISIVNDVGCVSYFYFFSQKRRYVL